MGSHRTMPLFSSRFAISGHLQNQECRASCLCARQQGSQSSSRAIISRLCLICESKRITLARIAQRNKGWICKLEGDMAFVMARWS